MIVINQILAGIRPEFENTPSEFRAVVGKAWGDDAKSRPSAAQMVEEHLFFGYHFTRPVQTSSLENNIELR